jgi:uncharacterized damage-inducible protein DinB
MMEYQAESTLLELIRYNNWANAQVLAAALKLTPEQQAASAPGAYGSIHATLGHLIAAEADSVHRLTGHGPRPAFRWEDEPALEDIYAFSGVVAEALLDAIRRTPPDHMVHEEEDGNTLEYKARLLFIQVIHHGIEHRTNVTTILSGLGLPAPEVDGWGYLVAHPEPFAFKETFNAKPDADPQS